MFEKETGDVFQDFGKQGASANAFTSFTKTSCIFSATDNIDLNLTTLLDFVQAPYFTAESVNKEKGIIGQEIQMYQDDPNWRQFFGIIVTIYIPNIRYTSILPERWKVLMRLQQKIYILVTTLFIIPAI